MNFNTIVFTRALGALAFFAMLTSCNQSDAPAAKTSAESVATSLQVRQKSLRNNQPHLRNYSQPHLRKHNQPHLRNHSQPTSAIHHNSKPF